MISIALLFVWQTAPADLVIENARIWSDGSIGFARFAAVRGGRFVYVGEPEPGFIGPKTERIDAQKRIVLPGLIDSHAHMLGGGMQLSQLTLRDAKDRADFVAKVEAWASSLPAGKWVLGGRWSTESWATREQPAKDWIDKVTNDRPTWLSRMDGHSGLANSAALKLAGITKDGPPDPDGGVIDRDSNGEPTGILRETAMSLVTRHIPAPTLDEKLEALKRALRHANSLGVTAVSDIPGGGEREVYDRLAAEPGEQTVRLFLYPSARPLTATETAFRTLKSRPGWLEVKGFKAYMDGSLGSRTAYMHAPYLGNAPDKADWRGLPMPGILDGALEREMASVAAKGKQPIVHAIGDEGNHLLLDAVSRIAPDPTKIRARSEHAQHLLPADIPRFAQLGVIASMQPYHKADDGRYAEEYIGKERCRSSYAFKDLLDAGAVVAFGSDWPVVSMNPFLGMEAAVTGRILGGAIWEPQQNLTATEALRAYTASGAYACYMEKEIGRIAPGYRSGLRRAPGFAIRG
ncbi:MAG TPA: amidohydrolase [Fimbriimonadaceae bacterium]|nr:amidohydrolase [Fimbriimonadaceae bacterium]HRJ96134.1 amidohydrolase [Fimbriimonadaceae bacterium]